MDTEPIFERSVINMDRRYLRNASVSVSGTPTISDRNFQKLFFIASKAACMTIIEPMRVISCKYLKNYPFLKRSA